MTASRIDVAILGGGIAGLAAAWEVHRAGGTFRLVEGRERFGGKIRSETRDGFLLEAGPDSFLTRKPDVLELVRELGIEDRLIGCREIEPRLFLLLDGELRELPPGMVALAPRSLSRLLGSRVLSLRGRLRFLAEPWVRSRGEEEDESLAAFARRRFGGETLERLVEPILAHLHVGDAERMSLEACYPQLAAMERRFGSVARAMRRARRAPGAPPFATLRGGVAELIEALVAALDPGSLDLGTEAVGIVRDPGGFEIGLRSGDTVRSRAVVVALPASPAARLLGGLDPSLEGLAALRTEPVTSVSYGFPRERVEHPLDGFGFFVPRAEGLRTLACTWTSSKFEHRAAPEQVLLRAFTGGAGTPDDGAASDARLLAEVLAELREILGLRGDPVLSRLHRTPDYPQYDVGHRRRVRELEGRLPDALRLAGSAFHGVGLPDVVRSGRTAAREVLGARG